MTASINQNHPGAFGVIYTQFTVLCMFAIRQAPHPLRSFCVEMTQSCWRLACVGTPRTYVQPHALRPLLLRATQCFGARHVTYYTKRHLARQAFALALAQSTLSILE